MGWGDLAVNKTKWKRWFAKMQDFSAASDSTSYIKCIWWSLIKSIRV